MHYKIKYIFNIMSSQGYIKNMGSTQTFIKVPYEKERYNDIHWDANYDGEQANIRLNIDDNGNNAEIRAKLDNNDLAQLLNVPSIRGDLDARLTNDFLVEREQEPSQPALILREPLHTNLKFQPFLRPQKKTHRLKYNKLTKQLKDPSPILVGKTAALQYRTPLPKTMRIHLTSDSSGRGKGVSTKKKKRSGKRKSTRRNRSVGLFRNLF
jgi:hypothetical protein